MDGVDAELLKILDTDLTHVAARRRVRDAFKEIQLAIDHCLLKASYSCVKMEESYEVNSRGLEIFTKSWLPEPSPMKAIVCYCHGYGDTCTFFFEGIAKKLASFGYGVFAMDYPGSGLSEGLHGYIPSFDKLVDDVVEHFSKIKGQVLKSGDGKCISLSTVFIVVTSPAQSLRSSAIWKAMDGPPRTDSLVSEVEQIFGNYYESMGGAVALKVHLKQPNTWTGAVLVAPMCKISDEMHPPWPLVQILIGIAKVLPKQKLVPQKDFAERAFRDLKKRNLMPYNVIAYTDKPRLGTALEMLRTTQDIERQLEQVSLPLLILHGEADIVTDPSVSKALYEKARNLDKKIRLYKDAYHCLLEGEPDEMILQVLNDIVAWLDVRSIRNGPSLSNMQCPPFSLSQL